MLVILAFSFVGMSFASTVADDAKTKIVSADCDIGHIDAIHVEVLTVGETVYSNPGYFDAVSVRTFDVVALDAEAYSFEDPGWQIESFENKHTNSKTVPAIAPYIFNRARDKLTCFETRLSSDVRAK